MHPHHSLCRLIQGIALVPCRSRVSWVVVRVVDCERVVFSPFNDDHSHQFVVVLDALLYIRRSTRIIHRCRPIYDIALVLCRPVCLGLLLVC